MKLLDYNMNMLGSDNINNLNDLRIGLAIAFSLVMFNQYLINCKLNRLLKDNINE